MADTVFEDFLADNQDFRDSSSQLAQAARQIFEGQFAADVHAGRVGYRAALDSSATQAREHIAHAANVARLRRMRGYHTEEVSKLPPKHNPLARRR